jgi:hypothetical protein
MTEAGQRGAGDLEECGLRRDHWIVGRIISVLRGGFLLSGSVIALSLLGASAVAIGIALGLAYFRDVGYPDSATLLRLGEFVHSGRLYPAFDRPPYLITLYGPLTYVLLAVPYGLASAAGISPLIPMRLAIVGALAVCVSFTFLLSRRLYGSLSMAWLSALFTLSLLPLAYWALQIRCDFLGLGFALFSVYLFLLTNGRRLALGAAICAGMALLIKQTFVAAPIAIVGWLIYRRRFKEAALWSACFVLTVGGGYAIVASREPLMLKHMAAIRRPVFEYREAFQIIGQALTQPVTLFFVIGGLLALWKCTPEKLLLVGYCGAGWLVAILTIPQIGGNINYFWEPLFASAVLAGSGLYELQRKARSTPILVILLLLIMVARWFVPFLHADLHYLRQTYASVKGYQERKREWEAFVTVISGRRLLSTFPDVTIHSGTPEIPDPYLNAVLERRGQWTSAPVVADIADGAFDLIIIGENDGIGWRGLMNWDGRMWGAVRQSYSFACVFEEMEVWLPRRTSSDLLPRLSAAGCIAPNKPSFLVNLSAKDQMR